VSVALAPASFGAGSSESIQQRRAFDFFRFETFPVIGGFFSVSTWQLVLQACDSIPTVRQAATALGALHEKISLQSTYGEGSTEIETEFPLKQYGATLASIRKYLSTEKRPKLDVILMCALICTTIAVMENNYANASAHLENSLHLLRDKSIHNHFCNTSAGSDMSLVFCQLDLHASKFQGRRPPAMLLDYESRMPGRFYSIAQAKDALSRITMQLYAFTRSVAEEYKYRKLQPVPLDEVAKLELIKNGYEAWKDRFDKFLHRSTSKFSRQEQSIIDILIINYTTDYIEASTCIQPGAMAFDQFDEEYDEIVTLAANVIRSRRRSNIIDFCLDISTGVIFPLYLTAIKCREPWIRQRAMSLLRSIRFQEGVWNAKAQASIAEVAIRRELSFNDPSLPDQRPLEFARVHSVGTIMDPVKRVAEVNLTQKLNGLDGPWHDHIEGCSW
jgi:hypothetical protein